MSVDYAARLSKYDNKGVCGIVEVFDTTEELEKKVKLLSEWVRGSSHVVVHTGAGISTAAGIPDFRGPKGVWTLEKQGKKLETDLKFEEAQPTTAHMVLSTLVEKNIIKYVISQNVDGLHIKSGLQRDRLSELHGNMFMERCDKCGKEYTRDTVVPTLGLKHTGNKCISGGAKGRCRGKLRDTVLDWEDELPVEDMKRAELYSSKADLSVCLGTSLQIVPAASLPLRVKKRSNGKLVICNLQPTRYDKQADLVIHYYVDEVLSRLMKALGLATVTETKTESEEFLTTT